MAPKPFKPPRPNNAATSSRRKSTTPKVGSSSKPTGISKKSPSGRKPGQEKRAKSSNQAAARNKEFNGASRLSSGSLAKLPSLSPLTSDGETRKDTGLETLISDDDNDDDDEIPVQLPSQRVNRNNSLSKRPEVDSPLAGGPRKEAAIPRDLVAVLLNEMFKNGAKKALEQNSHAGGKRPAKGRGQTRLTKQAVGAVGKYLDTFVREAVARAAHEVIERGGDGCLEVEDLERLAPQLILDF